MGSWPGEGERDKVTVGEGAWVSGGGGALAGDVPGTCQALSMWKLGASVEAKFSTTSLY